MLRTITAAVFGIAAAAMIATPIAAADDPTNADVLAGSKTAPQIVWPPVKPVGGYASGNNQPSAQPWIYSGPDCQPVMGTWSDVTDPETGKVVTSTFTADPNGTEVAYGSKDNLKRYPYKTGLH